jgi:hypothetical protein
MNPVDDVPAVYSYFTRTDLVIMRGTDVIVRKKVAYSPNCRGAVWTLDGKYVAAVVDEGKGEESASARQLLVIDVANGQSREIACPDCGSAAPIGGARSLLL